MWQLSEGVSMGQATGTAAGKSGRRQTHSIYRIKEGALLKIIKQIAIIFSVCWISQVIEHFLPFAFSASIIGMILLFFCLACGFLKIEHIQEKSDFLLSNMAFFFIPAGVSIINYFDVLKSNAWQILTICVITTIVTFGVTALFMRMTMRLMKRGNKKC